MFSSRVFPIRLSVLVLLVVALIVATESVSAQAYPNPDQTTTTIVGPGGSPDGGVAAGSTLSVSAVIRDEAGQPLEGVVLGFAITCRPAGSAASLSSTTATTDTSGMAAVPLAVGSTPGQICVSITANGVVVGSPTVMVQGIPTPPATGTGATIAGESLVWVFVPGILVLGVLFLVAPRKSSANRGSSS